MNIVHNIGIGSLDSYGMIFLFICKQVNITHFNCCYYVEKPIFISFLKMFGNIKACTIIIKGGQIVHTIDSKFIERS